MSKEKSNYHRWRVIIKALWEAGLVDMQLYSRENKGYKYALVVVDDLSKYAWAVPIKTKSGVNVTAAMQSILKQGRVPKNLHVDRGKEFYSKDFQTLMNKYNINLYSTYSNIKASMVERYNRTLKNANLEAV